MGKLADILTLFAFLAYAVGMAFLLSQVSLSPYAYGLVAFGSVLLILGSLLMLFRKRLRSWERASRDTSSISFISVESDNPILRVIALSEPQVHDLLARSNHKVVISFLHHLDIHEVRVATGPAGEPSVVIDLTKRKDLEPLFNSLRHVPKRERKRKGAAVCP